MRHLRETIKEIPVTVVGELRIRGAKLLEKGEKCVLAVSERKAVIDEI